MFIFFSVLIIIVSVLLVLIVLVQNSKGGGLASGFSSSNQFMGVRKTADFLEKATWTLAMSLVALCILSTITVNHGGNAKKSLMDDQIINTNENSGQMGFPTQAPKQNAAPAQKKEDTKK
jgi:preprotein translocase subunit SecG